MNEIGGKFLIKRPTTRPLVYEKASIDEHYLDISGMDRFIGCYKWAHELRSHIIRETGLPISFGLSVNKTVSKIATGEGKPNGEKEVPRDLVQPFLNPLPIKKIPGVGSKTCQLLHSMGVFTIHTLSDIPPEMMQNVLGKSGIDIWKKANGIDLNQAVRYSEEKSISSERTFETESIDIHMLERLLVSMVEKLAFKMRENQKLASVVTVTPPLAESVSVSGRRNVPGFRQSSGRVWIRKS